MIIELSPQVETIIKAQAHAQGISAEQLVNNALARQFRQERPFNFDIDELDKAINSGFKPMPKFNSDEEFLAWANA